MSQLTDFLTSKGGTLQTEDLQLSLMHTADGEDFVSIVTSAQINVSQCVVFKGEELAYFFLGRPAYKTAISYNPSIWQLPAVFVFDRLSHIVPKRVFPFDSGAFSDARFREIIGRIDIASFECGNDPVALARLIALFFSNVDRYRKAQPVSVEIIDELVGDDRRNFVPLALAKIYNYSLNPEIDDRARVIEFQYDLPVSLKDKGFKGVICCAEWLRDPVLTAALEGIGCRTLTYPMLPLSSSSYYSKIYELADEMSR